MKHFPYWREFSVFLGLVLFTYLSIGRDLSNPIRDSEWARMATTFAVVEKGTLSIDNYVQHTADWSRFGGHYYSAKAPGPALLAVPFYFVQHKLQSFAGIDADDPASRNLAIYIARLATTTIPTLAALALLFLVLLERFRLPPFAALMVCGAWAFGSLGFLYSVLFFGHQTSAAFLAIGICLSILALQVSRPRFLLLLLGGVAMGIAVASDYMAAIAVALWTVWLLWKALPSPSRWKICAAWIGGGVVTAIGLGFYHHACFGSFLTTSVSAHVVNPRWIGLNTIGFPSIDRLLKITFLPWRGIFFATPVWALILAGIYQLVRTRRFREQSELVVAALAALVYFGLLSMLPSAYGGWCLGPRYVVCALPLMALLLVEPARSLRSWFAPLLLISALMMLAAALVEPLAPEDFSNPWTEFVFPRFLENAPSPQYNVFGHLFGVSIPGAFVIYVALWGAAWTWLWRRLKRA